MPDPAKLMDSAESITTKAWERQENEPARWFLRFRNYLKMGARRSVNAVFEAERQEKAGKASNKAGSRWYGAARYWQWEARAAAYDANIEQEKALAMRDLAASMPYVSRPYRLVQLDTLAKALMRKIEEHPNSDMFLSYVKTMQALLHDISQEVADWGVTVDHIADSAALLTVVLASGMRSEDLV